LKKKFHRQEGVQTEEVKSGRLPAPEGHAVTRRLDYR
jgi:hypothetical protein